MTKLQSGNRDLSLPEYEAGVLTTQILCSVLRGSVVVKALCYKPKGRGFDSR
jgi:hypothetical protein